jgi:putative hemolysin
MNTTLIEIFAIILLIILNGILSMAEIAIVAASQSKLQQEAEAGKRSAIRALLLKEDPTRLLSNIQIWVTLIGISIGAIGRAMAETIQPGAWSDHRCAGHYLLRLDPE